MSLRLSDLLRRGRKLRTLAAKSARRRPLLDSLEERVLLSNVAPLWKPTTSDLSDAQNGPMANAGPGLINLYESYETYLNAGSQGTFTPPTNLYLVQGDQVAVDVVGWDDPTSFESKLQSLGMTVGATNATNEIAEGWIPIRQLPALSEMDQVVDVAGITQGKYYQEGSAPDQSDRTMYADAARSQFGVDGTGQKVGVLSNTVNQFGGGLAASVASGDLPNNVQVLDDTNTTTKDDEGRAMLEEVYDIAPGAALAFATAQPARAPGDVGFANNIEALAAAGATVEVDDYGPGDEPFFQNGVIGQAIDQVVSQGVTYLSAEGNSSAGGGYTSQFRSVRATIPGIGQGTYMNFNAGSGAAQTSIPYTLTAPGGVLDVQWDNPFYVTNGVKTEVDVYLTDPTTGQVVASARANTIANDQPVQDLDTSTLAPGTYNLVLKVAKGPAPSYIEALPQYGSGSIATPSSGAAGGTYFPSAMGHATDPNAIGVGAVAWWDASPWDGSIDPTPSEPFSSSGPALSIFSDTGVRQTPTVVNTPVISGADGNDISFALGGAGDASTLAGNTPYGEPGTPTELDADGLPNFFGTSSASPNVAAVVALMKQSNPSATPAEIRDSLIESAVPLNGGSNGTYDTQGGYGLVQAPGAIRSIDDHLSVAVDPPSNIYELTAINNYVIGTFTDAGATGGAAAFTASVDWGDGHMVQGTITADPNNANQYDVTASNTYQLGGTYTVTVTVNHIGYSIRTGSAPIVIVPYSISLTAVAPESLEEGQSYTGAIATLVDTLPVNSSISDYTTTITWSDGTTSAATLKLVTGQMNTYTVSTSKNFQTPGNDTFTVSVVNTGTATATLSGTQTVNDAPLLPGSAVPVSPTEGQLFSGNVAKFVDRAFANGVLSLPLSDYTATIFWGDGASSPGLVQNDPSVSGGFIVIGSHRYTSFGSYPLSVTVDDIGVPAGFTGATVTITNDITVQDATLTSQGTSFGLVEGTAFSGTAATFQSGDPSAPLSDFSATINWGDGSAIDDSSSDPSLTIVPTGGGGYVVRDSHIFINSGTFIGIVTINDAGGNSTQATINAVITVSPFSLSTAGLTPITSVEGSQFTGPVAILTDANIYSTIAHYSTVTINWGDGTSSNLGDAVNPSQIAPAPGAAGGVFVISGTHTYDHFGTYAITTTVDGVGGGTASASLSATATAAAFVVSGVSPNQAQLGVPYTNPVANFSDSNPFPTLSDFSAVINWGDNTSSAGTVIENPDQTFSVKGSHIYLVPTANATITVTVKDAAGQSKTVTSQISVPDATLSAVPVVVTPTPTEGTRFNALVGQFTDSNPAPNLGTLSATIDWGDGTATSTGTIQLDDGKYDVRGTHLYAAGNYEITVTVTSAYGAYTKINSTVNVAAAALTSTQPAPITLTQGVAFTGSTLVFSSADPTATAADFTFAQIDWGDGTITSNATVSLVAGGNFSVTGTHTYEQVGTYPITTTVESTSDSNTTQVLTATVQDAALSVKPAANFATKVGSSTPVTVASISYGDPTSTVASFAATINWGDNTNSAGALVPDVADGAGHFFVTGTHDYTAVGSYNVSVAVNDASGRSQTVALAATVGDASIALVSQPLTAVANSILAGQVATFSTGNPAAVGSTFAATISWGDGTTTLGTISPITTGVFGVLSSHTYANPGAELVTVTVNSSGGASASTSQTVPVAVQIQQITAQLTAGTVSGLPSGAAIATNITQPIFSGTGAPGNLITITAQRLGQPAPQAIATAFVGAGGTWAVTSGTLLDGTYSIIASAADSQGNATSAAVALPTLEVDTIGPRVVGVTLNPKTGQAIINFQDDFTGITDAKLLSTANYSLTLPTLRGNVTIAITGITVTEGPPNGIRTVTLNFASNTGRRGRLGLLAAGKYVLSINGTNLTDAAGNPLTDLYFSQPSAPKANTGYLASFVTNGRSIATPQSAKVAAVNTRKTVKAKSITVSTAAKPQAPKFHK